MQIDKDPNDRDVLIEQITILMKLNKENNLQLLFENILSTNQEDLKQLVSAASRYRNGMASK